MNGGRRTHPAVVGNPVLVGAVTTLVTIAAVAVSYFANNGLPFVPKYHLRLDVPSAGHLTRNADVRMGGTRIGQVVEAVALPNTDGPATARLRLTIDKRFEPLPVDTVFRIHPVSSIGLDFVDVSPGSSPDTLSDGALVSASQFRGDVPFEDFTSAFDAPTRAGIRRSIAGFATGLAGRGTQLNRTIGELDPLLRHVTPAMATLAAPRTDLDGFIDGLHRLARALAPVARPQAALYRNLATTFDAFSRDGTALRDAISTTPPAQEALVRDAPDLRRFLVSARRLSRAAAPGAHALGAASQELDVTFAAGRRGLPATRSFLPRLDALSGDLAGFADRPEVLSGVDRLRDFGRSLGPLVDFIAPAQTVCGYGGLLLRNLASSLKEGPQTGTAARIVLVAVTAARDSEAVLASGTSNSPEGKGLGPLRSNPYPNTAAPGQTRECEAGNESFQRARQVIGNVPGNQGAKTESARAG